MPKYNLICPDCRSTEMVIRNEDLDEDDEFFTQDAIVGCLGCGSMRPVSDWIMVETDEGGIVHMLRCTS